MISIYNTSKVNLCNTSYHAKPQYYDSSSTKAGCSRAIYESICLVCFRKVIGEGVKFVGVDPYLCGVIEKNRISSIFFQWFGDTKQVTSDVLFHSAQMAALYVIYQLNKMKA